MVLKKQEKLLNSLNAKGIQIMPKSEIHPKWYPDAKVICNGEVVMTTGSTQPELHVDVWSGNHPFFTGTQKILDTEGRVDRFMKKYGMGSANSATSKEQKVEKDCNKLYFQKLSIISIGILNTNCKVENCFRKF